MIEYAYRVVGRAGLHARPVALVSAAAGSKGSTVTVTCKGRSCDAANLVALMGLNARQGDELVFAIEGGDEAATRDALRCVCTF